jgi:DNA replication protein DnaC
VARLADERRAARQAELERALGRAGIPRRFQGRGFADYRAAGPEQQAALAVCRGYAERFEEALAHGRCLLLVGGPGTGKTHLACAILAAVIGAGRSGLFIAVSEALRLIRDAYSPRAARSESEAFALLTEPDLLVLDEVGVAIGDGEKRQAMLFDVLNARYGAQRPTVLIGNLTAAELGAYLGERIMDRLLESGSAVVPFTWASHRRGGRDV